MAPAIFTLAPSSTIDTATLSRLPAELTDMLVRESALDMAHRKLAEARTEVLNDKVRLEAKTGLLKGFSGKGSMDRETALKTVFSQKLHYDSQIKKAESLTALLGKETGRWLECYLKTGSPEYAAALAPHDYAEDWARFSYNFELLIKSFQMGLQDITVQYKRENPTGAPSPVEKGFDSQAAADRPADRNRCRVFQPHPHLPGAAKRPQGDAASGIQLV